MHSPRSDEPIYWLLFGAGGMTLAIVFPAILLVLLAAGFASPTVDSGLLSFAQVKGLLGNWFMALCLMGTVFLTIWHACHRIYQRCPLRWWPCSS